MEQKQNLKNSITSWYKESPMSSDKWFKFSIGDMTLSKRLFEADGKEYTALFLLVIKIKKEFRNQGHFSRILDMIESIPEAVVLDNCLSNIVIKELENRGYKSYNMLDKINYYKEIRV